MTKPFFQNGQWVCPNLPKGAICCPSGPRAQASQSYSRHHASVFTGGCPDPPDIVACGPKTGAICCPDAHVWISGGDCPIGEQRRGIDQTTLEVLQNIPTGQHYRPPIALKLGLIITGTIIGAGILIYLISTK